MIQQLYKRGFTLIELLVVIAIIGILASVVLASLNSARDKGTDAAAKSNLNNMRAQAEIIYDDLDSYATVCTATADMWGPEGANGDCDSEADSWAASVQLTSASGTVYYCVDSSGNGGETDGPHSDDAPHVCP